jgi:hypothetical protein
MYPFLIPNLPQFVVTGHQICWTWNTVQICWIEKRPKLDPNREIHIGASRCYEVLEAFKQYHQCIHDTKRNFKHGLLIDLHGRGMDDGVTQIGKKLMDACFYSNLDTKIFLLACLFCWDPNCCKRFHPGTCVYSNLETHNVTAIWSLFILDHSIP